MPGRIDIKTPTWEHRLAERNRPARRPLGYQHWRNLLFLHWEVPPARIQATLPKGLWVDSHEGSAYVGIVPFAMERIRPAWLPPLPWLSWFLELNVRTYVHDAQGRPGVWFYSLDCNQPVAVRLAVRFFHLPYRRARMQMQHRAGRIDYRCAPPAGGDVDEYQWRSDAPARPSEPGTLEFFLLERYRLFARSEAGHLFTGTVHHRPYQASAGQVSRFGVHVARRAGFELLGPPCSVLASPGVAVSIFPLDRLG